MKLLRFVKNDGKWRAVVGSKSSFGDLGFPTFINDGVIELYKEQSAPSLHIDPYKESIVYQNLPNKLNSQMLLCLVLV